MAAMLVAVRATHEHLDLGVLDALSRDAATLAPRLRAGRPPIAGAVVLATCNRLEVYLDAERFHESVQIVIDAIAETTGAPADAVAERVEAAVGSDAVAHLYEVIAGLRSVVRGESEIAGQVRAAYLAAVDRGESTSMLNDLFQMGLRQAKRVASTTRLGASGRTGAGVALDRARHLLRTVHGRSPAQIAASRVLLIGTGAYARVMAAELPRRGVHDLHVHSVSGRADAFAATHDATAVDPADLAQEVAAADLIIACSGQGETTLRTADLLARGGRPVVVLDLALHSDVEDGARAIPGVDVISLADLAEEQDAIAAEDLAAAREILADGVDAFISKQEIRRLDPAVTALRSTVREALDEELVSVRAELAPEVAADVERRLRRIVGKMLHTPMARAQEVARSGGADAYMEALHTIFGIDLAAPARGDAVVPVQGNADLGSAADSAPR